MSAYILDAVRTPFGRYGGALAKVRPDDLGAHVVKAILERAPDLDPAQIDDVTFGNANGAGEDNRNVGRMAVLLAGLPDERPGEHRQPPLRIVARRRDARQPRDRDRRRRRRAGRRRGVDEPRAVGHAQAREGLPRRPTRSCSRATLGWRMVNPEMPGAWTISLGEIDREAGRHLRGRPRGAGRLRAAQPPARRRGLEPRLLRPVGRPRRGLRARRGHPRRLDAREAGQAQAGLRQGRHGDGGQRLAAQRRRLRRCCVASEAGGAAGREPIARIAGRGTFAVDPDIFGIGPVEAANRALDARRHRLGPGRRRRAQRGLRGAVAGLHRRVADRPRARERATAARSRSGTRSARPVAASWARSPIRCARTAGSTASRRSASASVRDWRSFWRPV